MGRNYKEVWDEEDTKETETSQPKPIQEGINPTDNSNGERTVACGDLTQRVLSALIGETSSSSYPISSTSTSQSKIQDKSPLALGGDSSLQISIPPTFDYSYESMMNLEERIKSELRCIGLLDDHLDVHSLFFFNYKS